MSLLIVYIEDKWEMIYILNVPDIICVQPHKAEWSRLYTENEMQMYGCVWRTLGSF